MVDNDKYYSLAPPVFTSKITENKVTIIKNAFEKIYLSGKPELILAYLNLLDGTRNIEQIYKFLIEKFNKDDIKNIKQITNTLFDHGYLIEGTNNFKSLNERYSRQLSYFSLHSKSSEEVIRKQESLANAKVAIIGMGGIGSPLSDVLVRAGICNLILIDNDTIELSNLNRQNLFTEEDLGGFKTDIAEKRLKKINQDIKIRNIKLEISNKEDIEKYVRNADIVVVSADTPRGKIVKWCLDAFKENEVPLIYTGYSGDIGIVGPLIKKDETDIKKFEDIVYINKRLDFENDNVDMLLSDLDEKLIPPSTGPICNIVSSIAAQEIINYLTTQKSILFNSVLRYNSFTYDITINDIKGGDKNGN